MQKYVRALLTGGALLLAASMTASAASRVKAAGGNPAFVMFWLAPQKIVCTGEEVPIVVSYSYVSPSESEGLAPLAPLVPIGKAPGKLTVKGTLSGTIATMGVGFGPGHMQTTHKFTQEGQETLTATVDYSSASSIDTRSFEVKKCNYNLVIKAWNDKKEGGTIVTSYFSAEGMISVGDDGSVSGELREDAWVDISSDNPVEVCELSPLPMASGKLTVSGTRTTSASGTTTLHLVVSYGEVSGFPDNAQILCFNKVENKKIDPVPFNLPNSADAGDYLYSTLDFVNGQSLTGTYGPGGHSDYIIEENQ